MEKKKKSQEKQCHYSDTSLPHWGETFTYASRKRKHVLSALLQMYPYQQVQKAGDSPSNKPVNQRKCGKAGKNSQELNQSKSCRSLDISTILINVYLLL